MQSYQQTFITLALKHDALRFGEFKLKSGRISPYFFNMGHLNTGLALKILGECYAQAISQADFQFDVIFGPAYKGIPLACATSIALSSQYQKDYPYAFNRKEAKDHGEGGNIIGASLKNRILIIDDVITAGTAIRESLQLIATAQGTVAGIIVALDRQEKGQENKSAIDEIARQINCPVKSIICFSDIIEYVENEPALVAFKAPMAAYRERYGA